MTEKEKAIEWLKACKETNYRHSPTIQGYMDIAISALYKKKGEWIKVHSGDKDFPESIVCSKCWNENSHFDFNEHAEPIGKVFVTSKFCPNCDADMRGE